MKMNMVEYCLTQHPIKDVIRRQKSDPVKRILEADSIPCDDVIVFDGKLQKVLEVSDGEYMSVVEALSYTIEEIKKIPPSDLRDTLLAFNEKVEVRDIDLTKDRLAAQAYMNEKRRKREYVVECTQ